MTDRTDYINGLRELADLLEQHDDLPLPSTGTSKYNAIDWHLFGGDIADDLEKQKDLARVIVRALPGQAEKWETGELFRFHGRVGGLVWQVLVERDAVCERVVTTREVTEMVPDPSVSVPLIEITKTVEDVEWECGSLLADPAVMS